MCKLGVWVEMTVLRVDKGPWNPRPIDGSAGWLCKKEAIESTWGRCPTNDIASKSLMSSAWDDRLVRSDGSPSGHGALSVGEEGVS
jgi:hypothetical protein